MSALFAVSLSTRQVQLLDSTPAHVDNVLYSAYLIPVQYTACYINTDPGIRAKFYS